ncbi:hypothetical protein K469DRAFT_188231 [Zopfia rhizophila CBS 207.26]|uniref:Cell wall protein PhiA n=1 Tax=Zopfia rhizophila CBS 207.26 TaxID=1314779 RepID=A0A6A6ERP7_9PEZI|nr:hypothetical protein K469DRAFT_188231 [Zopfia rhizophila CBS 207.26]
MQFKNIALFATAAAAIPTPQIETPSGDDKFGLIAIHSGSPIQNVGATAWKGNILIGGVQNASCDSPSDFATFYLNNGSAYLYAASATPQQLYVDRSGMGQGKTGYTTGAQPAPRNAERTGFSINSDGHLVFDGQSPQACPTGLEGNAYSVWFSSLENPGFNQNCTGIALRAIKTDSPVSCLYTSD